MDDHPGIDSSPPPTGGGEHQALTLTSEPTNKVKGVSERFPRYSSPQQGKPKGHTKAIVLSVFLGWFGAGRFFLGHIQSAILQLVALASVVGGIIFISLVTPDSYFYACSPIVTCMGEVPAVIPLHPTLREVVTTGVGVFSVVIPVLLFVWWVVDLVRICTKKLEPKDGYYI